MSRVPVPGTATVCSSSASKTSSISRGGHAGGLGADALDESAAAGLAQGGRGAVAFQEPGDGLVVEAGAQDALQAGVELGEQAAYPVGGAGGLGGEVLVEADEDRQFGGDLAQYPVCHLSSRAIEAFASSQHHQRGSLENAFTTAGRYSTWSTTSSSLANDWTTSRFIGPVSRKRMGEVTRIAGF